MSSQPPWPHLSGFGNHHASVALPGALPLDQNSPQRPAHGLVAELLSGTAFTAPRASNLRTWLYRRKPSVLRADFALMPDQRLGDWPGATSAAQVLTPPVPLRWAPLPRAQEQAPQLDAIDGLRLIARTGSAERGAGVAVHWMLAKRSMERAFINADADMLWLPQHGRFTLRTELGVMQVSPGEIAHVPRGMAWQLLLETNEAGEPQDVRAYVCENFGAAFRLPELGPIGSNGLAHARDFLSPVAAAQPVLEAGQRITIVQQASGHLWRCDTAHTPFDVLAWRGNLVPYVYDTRRFMTIGSVSIDHPDPSIFTVLTSPSDTPGVANADLEIFPPRWMVAEHTFRPPWYHRNVMSELMGLIHGQYDAKPEGFQPGGVSLHNAMVPHGPDTQAFQSASQAELSPHKLDHTLAFMIECRDRFSVSAPALGSPLRDTNYLRCWHGL